MKKVILHGLLRSVRKCAVFSLLYTLLVLYALSATAQAMDVSMPDTLYRKEYLSVKTNLLFYGVYMPGYNRWCPIPNVAVEYYP